MTPLTVDWLLAVGCSLTWGTEITQPRISLLEDKELAWPAHLGKSLSAHTIINRGLPGRSNGSIFRVAMEELVKCYNEHGTNGIVVVQWTGPDRLEFVNPFYFDIQEFYKNEVKTNHPGQEGSYLCVSPAELTMQSIQQQFVGLDYFFVNHWAHKFYQTELLVNNSIALTSLANRLGIKILQFNGIDQLDISVLQEHAKHMPDLIGVEYFHPYERDRAFWPSVREFPQYRVKAGDTINSKLMEVPTHPTAEEHQYWAEVLYNYIQTTYQINSDR
jgi:lysophospholipase L1-like esterase